jgi:hypothetical protein
MKSFQKLLLAIAVMCLVSGISVSFTHAQVAPAWIVAFPAGVVHLGLLLISRLLQKEAAKCDEEESSSLQSAMRYQASIADTGKNCAESSTHPRKDGAGHSSRQNGSKNCQIGRAFTDPRKP